MQGPFLFNRIRKNWEDYKSHWPVKDGKLWELALTLKQDYPLTFPQQSWKNQRQIRFVIWLGCIGYPRCIWLLVTNETVHPKIGDFYFNPDYALENSIRL